MWEWTRIEPAPGVTLDLVAGSTGLREIRLNPGQEPEGRRNDANPLLARAAAQLTEYFGGSRRDFDLPLEIEGTGFQRKVWKALEAIPYGATRSYRDIAGAIGAPEAVRAVGAANGRNPLPIVLPCHRVIGSSGKLVGYGGGLELKKRLLELERPRTGALPGFDS